MELLRPSLAESSPPLSSERAIVGDEGNIINSSEASELPLRCSPVLLFFIVSRLRKLIWIRDDEIDKDGRG